MLTRHAPLLLALAVLSCTTVPISFPSPDAGAPAPASGSTAVAAEVVSLTTDARVRSGLRALATNARLMEAARLHAEQMAMFEQGAHTIAGARYPTMESRLAAAGYVYSTAAENVAWNQRSAQDVVSSWMNSSGHRANILDADFTEMGAAMARSSRGAPYWIQVFGRPRQAFGGDNLQRAEGQRSRTLNADHTDSADHAVGMIGWIRMMLSQV